MSSDSSKADANSNLKLFRPKYKRKKEKRCHIFLVVKTNERFGVTFLLEQLVVCNYFHAFESKCLSKTQLNLIFRLNLPSRRTKRAFLRKISEDSFCLTSKIVINIYFVSLLRKGHVPSIINFL